MIIGRSLRYQDSDLLCRMYYCGDREVFEFYREYDKSIPVSRREHQLLEKVTVLDEARIKVTFRSGVEIEQALEKDERSVTA